MSTTSMTILTDAFVRVIVSFGQIEQSGHYTLNYSTKNVFLECAVVEAGL